MFPLAGVFALLQWARGKPVGDASGLLGVAGGVAVFGAVAYRDPGRAGYPFEALSDNAVFIVGLQGTWWRRLVELQFAAIQPTPIADLTQAIAGVLLFAGAAALAWSARRWGAALLGLWILPLLPVHGLVGMPFWGADRHLLYPSMAVAIAVAIAGQRFARWWLPALLCVPLLVLTHQRIPDWHDSLALWQADAERPGDHWVRGLMYGTTLGRAGRFEAAAAAYRQAEVLQPESGDLLARRLIAEMAIDGWSEIDKGITRSLQPPPQGAEDWTRVAQMMRRLEQPGACDAAAMAQRLGAPPLDGC